MTDWWAVSAAWAGAAGSFAAVVVALYIAGRGWRDAAARERRAQAQLVVCYVTWGQPTRKKGASTYQGPVWVMRNDSNQSIYQVEIPEAKIEVPLIQPDSYTSEAMTPPQAASFGFGTPAYEGPYPVAAEFSDAAGLRWFRNRDGSLQQLSPRAPWHRTDEGWHGLLGGPDPAGQSAGSR